MFILMLSPLTFHHKTTTTNFALKSVFPVMFKHVSLELILRFKLFVTSLTRNAQIVMFTEVYFEVAVILVAFTTLGAQIFIDTLVA